VIAEMRGVVDDKGHSPFWEAVGRHFFDVEFPDADYLSMVDKRFIADLMPKHPIYIPLLPKEAQEVIGKVHEQTIPAMRMLEGEGFKFAGMVDIFEAGPVVTCARDEIRTVRSSVRAKVAEITDEALNGEDWLIANARLDYRCCKGSLQTTPAGVRLGSATALALQVKVGDAVRYVTVRSPKIS